LIENGADVGGSEVHTNKISKKNFTVPSQCVHNLMSGSMILLEKTLDSADSLLGRNLDEVVTLYKESNDIS